MAANQITNVVEINVQSTITETGGTLKNIFTIWHYYQNPTQPSPPSAVAVANQFLSAIYAPIAAQLSAGLVGAGCLARYLDVTTNPNLSANVPANGAIVLPRLPAQQAIVTPLRSVIRGKSFRGTKHFGGVPTASVTGDELTAGAVTAWTALLPSLIAQITVTGQTFSPCIVSRSLSQLRQDPVTIIGAALLQALLNKTIGTMRRRKEKTVR